MGAFIDNEVSADWGPYSHAAGYEACERTELVACSDLRVDVMGQVGQRYGVPSDAQYTDYRGSSTMCGPKSSASPPNRSTAPRS